jgi:signal transduction histidine kinase
MKFPEITENEQQRLDALNEYSILDTLPEKEFDEITALASYICKTPISLISLIDDKRQWFKSKQGLSVNETAKEIAFCAHAINKPDEVFIIPDSRKDDRFHDNPLVTAAPFVIFYAGVPLKSDKGLPLGTLCIIDNIPRELEKEQIEALQFLANQVSRLLDKRKQGLKLQMLVQELENKNTSLNNFVRIAAHDLKSPLHCISMLSDLVLNENSCKLNPEGFEMIAQIKNSSTELSNLIDGILQYSMDASIISKERKSINLSELLQTVTAIVDPSNSAKINLLFSDSEMIFSNQTALEQILINILTNSIKYNDKETTVIDIEYRVDAENVMLSICDNGPGVKEDDRDRIFEIFQTASIADKFGRKGSGIGLATVKSLVAILDGKVEVFPCSKEGLKTVIHLKK